MISLTEQLRASQVENKRLRIDLDKYMHIAHNRSAEAERLRAAVKTVDVKPFVDQLKQLYARLDNTDELLERVLNNAVKLKRKRKRKHK